MIVDMWTTENFSQAILILQSFYMYEVRSTIRGVDFFYMLLHWNKIILGVFEKMLLRPLGVE